MRSKRRVANVFVRTDVDYGLCVFHNGCYGLRSCRSGSCGRWMVVDWAHVVRSLCRGVGLRLIHPSRITLGPWRNNWFKPSTRSAFYGAPSALLYVAIAVSIDSAAGLCRANNGTWTSYGP